LNATAVAITHKTMAEVIRDEYNPNHKISKEFLSLHNLVMIDIQMLIK
jgi:hypothetical protein